MGISVYFKALIFLVVFILIAKGVTLFMRIFLRERIKKKYFDTLVHILYYFIILIFSFSFLHIFEINAPHGWLLGGIAGLGIGFACQGAVGNMFSGLYFLMKGTIKIGDTILIKGLTGTVKEIDILSLGIKTYHDHNVRIPNYEIFQLIMKNIGLEYEIIIRPINNSKRSIHIINGIVQKHPLAIIRLETFKTSENIVRETAQITLRVWIASMEMSEAKKELHRINQELEKENIEIGPSNSKK